ncbi:hypothetical protein CLTEP_16610 [Clostridium tepidiprofundi DSM 19306]|uniref:HipA N-terminal subdomain 1 domain-containing protein n=1 Tax=Clostridium tepidiprofundi DSM 19306 TaxID=1121338 RepID=A0A151B3D4_9CLOT|nr:hypothetical protein [Clostridium tepidiprofundi]KYH34428.1 hypothetical protein CLTEP_16610 [Clostridium tepidiprofundi DSM 19306]
MIDKYVLMCRDVPVGDLVYDTNTRKFRFAKYDSIKDRKYLPLGMYTLENWNIDYQPTHDDIVFWLKDRVVPKERANIDDILRAMGLIDYDFWELCRRTRAMCMEDYFWLSKGEKYEEVHLRHLAEHNRINETPIPFEAIPYPS